MGGRSSHNLDERHDKRQEGWADVFGNQITARQSLIDLAGHYEYTPERWRVFVDGVRQYIQYGSAPQYAHNVDTHDLTPAAGETVTLESADDVIYTVQFELALTWAFELSQQLQTGDRLRVGIFDDQDGWYMEQDSSHATDEADFVIRRQGSESSRDTFNIEYPTTKWARLKLETGWYRVTRQRWERSYPEEGEQQNPIIGRTDPLPNKGPAKGNLPLRFQITAGSGTSNLTLKAGSTAAILSGDPDNITRAKNYRETFTLATGTGGNYVPVLAFRRAPDGRLVRMEFTDTNIPKFTGNDDIIGLLLACGKEKVLDSNGNQLTDSNFDTPNELNNSNSVVQTTTDVAQFPDNTGTPVTSAANPGGYQLGLSTLYTSGSAGKIKATGTNTNAKRVVANGDLAVLAIKTPAAGDFDYEATIEQDY